jgi:hypothetical protein
MAEGLIQMIQMKIEENGSKSGSAGQFETDECSVL